MVKIVVKLLIFISLGYLIYLLVMDLKEEQSMGSNNYLTAYVVFCNEPALDIENCTVRDTAVPTNFSIDLDQQRVMEWLEDPLLGQKKNILSNCIIVDNNNWSCDSWLNGKQGFNGGIYFNESNNNDTLEEAQGYAITVSKKDWENINKKLYK